MSFDGIASEYDHNFTERPLARWLRARVWRRLDGLFTAGMRVLELGCGTGEDACYLAERGLEVVATDASAAMLKVTQTKAAERGLKLQTHLLDLSNPANWAINGHFDGVYSNFGALNCTSEWAALGAWLHQIVKPEGVLGFGIMGRVCLWETAWYAAHLDFKRATRRWSGSELGALEDGTPLQVYYPTPTAFNQAMQPYFTPTDLGGLGVVLPPSNAFGVIESRPQLMRRLIALEETCADWPFLRALGDHYWISFKRR